MSKMQSIIEVVLEQYENKQVNLGSKVARELLAKDIEEALCKDIKVKNYESTSQEDFGPIGG